MSSAEGARVFSSTVTYQWPGGLGEARARLGRPEAQIEGSASPARVLTLKESRGHVIIPPGEPMLVHNAVSYTHLTLPTIYSV